MARSRKRPATGLQGVSLGLEFAAALVGLTLVGLWIDMHYGTSPWGLLICLGVGTIGGLYNFIRSSLRILRTPPTSASRSTSTPQSPDDPRDG